MEIINHHVILCSLISFFHPTLMFCPLIDNMMIQGHRFSRVFDPQVGRNNELDAYRSCVSMTQ